MKKIILLITLSLFSISGLFAQWSNLTVYWTLSGNCNCNGSIDSVFKVTMEIYDVANDNYKVKDDKNWESGSTDHSVFDVNDVKYYCNELNHDNTPRFNIYVSVKMYCKNPSLVLKCKGKVSVLAKSCYDFANGYVSVPTIALTP